MKITIVDSPVLQPNRTYQAMVVSVKQDQGDPAPEVVMRILPSQSRWVAMHVSDEDVLTLGIEDDEQAALRLCQTAYENSFLGQDVPASLEWEADTPGNDDAVREYAFASNGDRYEVHEVVLSSRWQAAHADG